MKAGGALTLNVGPPHKPVSNTISLPRNLYLKAQAFTKQKLKEKIAEVNSFNLEEKEEAWRSNV